MKEIDEMRSCDHDFVEEKGTGGNKGHSRVICSECRLPEEAYKVGHGKRIKQ